ncbi:peroxidase 10 [Dorcoceras hygrometricum]|uniref:Peroxidase 10 n=1 Tax=Dorcoceras hygrometricum TaxID=472368 RepID=A0A2Z7B0W7_9LAMI|nr:peroxidase 10 [Dorcoceras hygrometricum]
MTSSELSPADTSKPKISKISRITLRREIDPKTQFKHTNRDLNPQTSSKFDNFNNKSLINISGLTATHPCLMGCILFNLLGCLGSRVSRSLGPRESNSRISLILVLPDQMVLKVLAQGQCFVVNVAVCIRRSNVLESKEFAIFSSSLVISRGYFTSLESLSCYLLHEILITVHRTLSSSIIGGRRISLEQGWYHWVLSSKSSFPTNLGANGWPEERAR